MGKKNEKEVDELMRYIEFEMYDQCLDIIDRLLCKYPGDNIDIQSFLYFIKSNIYHRTHKVDEEISCLLEFNKIKPDMPIVEHNLGNTFSKQKNSNVAEKHYLKAIELMGGIYPLAFCNLGLLYVDMHRIKDAKEQLAKAEKFGAPKNSIDILRKRIKEAES
jgi:tetratricopeptide (TPR) repeat protein